MGWILLCTLLIIFFLTFLIFKPDTEKRFYIKICVLYLSSVLSLQLGSFPLPIGLAIGFFIVEKGTTINKSIKRLALIYGLLFFLLVRLIPAIQITEMINYSKDMAIIKRFDDVRLIQYYKPDSKEQTEFRRYISQDSDEARDYSSCILIFRTWVLDKENKEIRDKEWLWSVSPNDMRFKDSYHFIDDNTTEGYIQFEEGDKYFAQLKRVDGKYNLVLVISYGKIKAGKGPQPFFGVTTTSHNTAFAKLANMKVV